MDPYRILGVARGCTREEVKEAFRAKVPSAHPDRGGEDLTFIQLRAAYEQILAELDRRPRPNTNWPARVPRDDGTTNHPTFSDSEFNPYAPPKAPIGEPIRRTPMNAMSRPRCTTSLFLGSVSIILSLFELGLFALLSLMEPRRSSGSMPPGLFAVLFGWLGFAAVLGSLGLWLVRAELRASRSISLAASAVRFCLGGIVCTILDAIFVSIFTIYTWLT